jgi:hypothetical protein
VLTPAVDPIARERAALTLRILRLTLSAERLVLRAESKGDRMTTADDAQLEAVRRGIQRLGQDLERAANVGLAKVGRQPRYTRSFWT